MGSCCKQARPLQDIANDKQVVVVNIFKNFEKDKRKPAFIKQAKTDNHSVITIKQLTNKENEICEKALIRVCETIIQTNNIHALLAVESSSNANTRISDSSKKPNQNMCLTSEPKQHSEKLASKQGNKEEQMKLTDHHITAEEQLQIKQIFHRLFIFDVFPEDILDLLLSSLVLFQVFPGDFLYKKGFESQFFYIVKEGTLEVYKDNKVIKEYHAWDSFGHNSLITNDHIIQVDESVKCVNTSKLFLLSAETFISIKEKIIKIQMQERYDFINTIIFFQTLDSITKHNIAEKMTPVTFLTNSAIISKGEKGNNIYMIKEGSVSCQINKVEVQHLGVSKYFGIVSLFKGGERTLDVIASEKTVCFELTISDLTEAIGNNFIEVIMFTIFKEFLMKNMFFAELIREESLNELFTNFKLKSYNKNELIYVGENSENVTNKRIIIVIEGNLMNTSTKKVEYKSGAVIGENIVKNYDDIPKNLIAFPDCLTLEAEVDSIPNLLGEEFKANTQGMITKVAQLQELHLFSKCSENLLKQIAMSYSKEKYLSSSIIIKEDGQPDYFYIILKGRVEILIRNQRIRLLEEDSFFGERALMELSSSSPTSKPIKHTATVKAFTEVNCLRINPKDFALILTDKSVKDQIQKQIFLQDNKIDINDLKLIKHVGNGKFGSVDLVHNNKSIYAIKAIIRKDADAKKRMAGYLQEERRVLLSIDHPLIGKIVKTYQNEYYVFLLLEYINGQNMKSFLDSHQSVLNINDVRFYIASLLLVIDYIHRKKIVHRDIKLNNLLLDEHGYIKLVDFGTAKTLTDYTNTIIGTPHYMSPEVLKGKGYSFSCDYWSSGICAYELLFKKYPFGTEATEVMEIYNEVIYSEFSFPKNTDTCPDFMDFINVILQKQVTKRMCNLNKFKKLEFFSSLNWDELFQLKIASPYKPNIIDFSEIDLKMFKSPYEEYINRDMYSGYGQNNGRDNRKSKSDYLWAREFNM